jgi:hypothetical protein
MEMELDTRRIRSGFDAAVSQLASETGDSEEDILVKSIGLLVIVLRAERQGKIVVITTPSADTAKTGIRIT